MTDSWRAYQDCTRSIQHFVNEIAIEDVEVWVGDVCLGTPDHPRVSAPLQIDSGERVHRAVWRAHDLVAVVMESLQIAVKTSRRVIEELGREGVVESAGFRARTPPSAPFSRRPLCTLFSSASSVWTIVASFLKSRSPGR